MATRRLLNVVVEPVPGTRSRHGGGQFHYQCRDDHIREDYAVRSLSVSGHAITDEALESLAGKPGKQIRVIIIEEDADDD